MNPFDEQLYLYVTLCHVQETLPALQTLLAVLAGITPHYPSTAALASLRDACAVTAMSQPAHEFFTDLQAVGMVTVVTACVYEANRKGRAEGVHWACMNERSCVSRLVKFLSVQYSPPEQARRIRAVNSAGITLFFFVVKYQSYHGNAWQI